MLAQIQTIESIYKSNSGNYTCTSPVGTSSSTSVTFTSPFATYPGVDRGGEEKSRGWDREAYACHLWRAGRDKG